MSEDPLGFMAGDGNAARYVGNGIVNSWDPSGLDDLPPGWTKLSEPWVADKLNEFGQGFLDDMKKDWSDLFPGSLFPGGDSRQPPVDWVFSSWDISFDFDLPVFKQVHPGDEIDFHVPGWPVHFGINTGVNWDEFGTSLFQNFFKELGTKLGEPDSDIGDKLIGTDGASLWDTFKHHCDPDIKFEPGQWQDVIGPGVLLIGINNSREKCVYLSRRGFAHYFEFERKDAYQDFQECLQLGHKTARIRFGLARCAATSDERRQEAMDVAKELVGVRSTAHLGYCVQGIAFYTNHQWAAAENALTQAIARKPDWAEPYVWRGRCRLRTGKWQGCVDDVLKAMSRPESATFDLGRCRIMLAIALGKLGDESAAVGNLRLLTKWYRKEGRFPNALWLHLTCTKKYEEALGIARVHTVDVPRDACGWRHLALSLAQFGELDKAFEAAQKAVDLDLISQDVWGVLARVQLLRGEYAQAYSSFRRAAKLSRTNEDNPLFDCQDVVRLVLFLATCPDSRWRNGPEARRITEFFSGNVPSTRPAMLHSSSISSLLATIDTVLVSNGSRPDMRLSGAFRGRHPLVDDLATVGTKTHGRIGLSMVEVGARCNVHADSSE